MLIYPAIDLIEGRCVRLLRGDFEHVTRYGDPVDQIRQFADTGARWAHVVDLDGARASAPVQTALIERLAHVADIRVQVGGGVRTREHVVDLLAAGAERVVVGSVAARAPAIVQSWLCEFGAERICCAFDVRPEASSYAVAVSGWRETSALTLDIALSAFEVSVLRHVLITDISRDGALIGPNIALIKLIVERFPLWRVQASGGVSSISDIASLRAAGAGGAVVGRALYERRFALEEALAC